MKGQRSGTSREGKAGKRGGTHTVFDDCLSGSSSVLRIHTDSGLSFQFVIKTSATVLKHVPLKNSRCWAINHHFSLHSTWREWKFVGTKNAQSGKQEKNASQKLRTFTLLELLINTSFTTSISTFAHTSNKQTKSEFQAKRTQQQQQF